MEDEISAAAGLRGRILAASADEATEPRRVALHALASRARELIERLVATTAPREVLEAATVDLAATTERFEGYEPVTLIGFAEVATAGNEPGAVFDHSPMIGKANPLSPPMTLRIDDDRVVGRVTFGSAYEGPPGCVHGGYVAAMFDELLGGAQSLSGHAGMTGTLTIRYLRPTPLHTELQLEATVDRVEGRKIFCKGTCHVDGEKVSEAEGIFISLTADKFVAMRGERDARFSSIPPPSD